MNNLNSAIVSGYISLPEVERRGGVVNCFRFVVKNNTGEVPCQAYGRTAERLLDLYDGGFPVRVVGRLDSFGDGGQFRVLVEHADAVSGVELTDVGRDAVKKNGGKIIIQSTEAGGVYDYTEFGSVEQVLDHLKEEVRFEDWMQVHEEDLRGEYANFVLEACSDAWQNQDSSVAIKEEKKFMKDYPFERFLSARKSDLKDRWEKELFDSLGEYSLDDLIEENDPNGFGVEFGYLKETLKGNHRNLNQVIIEGVVSNVSRRLSGDHNDFLLTGKKSSLYGGRKVDADFTVRSSASLKVFSDAFCQDGNGARIVGSIHSCSIPNPDGTARQGVEVLAECVEYIPLRGVSSKKRPAVERDGGWGY